MPPIYVTVSQGKAVAADWSAEDAEDRRLRFLSEGLCATWYRVELPPEPGCSDLDEVLEEARADEWHCLE
jgi:hypothetical protein